MDILLLMYLYYYNNTTHGSFLSLDGFSFTTNHSFAYVLTLAHHLSFVLIFGCYLWICGCGVGVVGVLRYNS